MSPARVLIALLGGLLLALTACASRPDRDSLTQAIMTAAAADATVEISESDASCIAQYLLDSSLSDTTLAGLAEDFDEPEVLSSERQQVEPLVSEAATVCRSNG